MCVCVCEERVRTVLFFASVLPWQPAFAGEHLPFFFKHFFSLTSKKTVHINTANCILFVVCYVIIERPNMQIADINMRTHGSQGTAGTSITCRLYLFPTFSLSVSVSTCTMCISGSINKPLCVSYCRWELIEVAWNWNSVLKETVAEAKQREALL